MWVTSWDLIAAGSMVTRSLRPLPSRMTIWFVAKSTSFTRRRQHSSRRSPEPYSKTAMSRCTPVSCWRTARTSSRANTTGRYWPFRPDDVVEPRQLDVENVAVQEEQCAQRLVLGRGRDLAVDGERGQERGYFGRAHLDRVPLAVEEDVPPDPVNVGLLGAAAVVPGADGLADAVEESWLGRAPRAGFMDCKHCGSGACRRDRIAHLVARPEGDQAHALGACFRSCALNIADSIGGRKS